MIITLPKDIVRIEKNRKCRKNRFAFNPECNKMTLPGELCGMWPSEKYGVDIWVSQSEKCAYLKFVPREKSYFKFCQKTGYVGCSDFFKWASNLEIPVFKDYNYTDYQIDKKNKVVKLNLVRK